MGDVGVRGVATAGDDEEVMQAVVVRSVRIPLKSCFADRASLASRIGPLWVMSQGITATPDAPPGPGSAGAATVSPDAETRAAAKTPPKTIESNSRRKVITGKDLAAAPNVLCVQFRSASGSPILWPRALKRMSPFLRR